MVVVDSLRPMLDIDLLNEMIRTLSSEKLFCCVSQGAIPGTDPMAVINLHHKKVSKVKFSFNCLKNAKKVKWKTQFRHNNQFNLGKFKRLKQFIKLISMKPDIYKLSIEEFVSLLKDKKVLNFLAFFSEDVRAINYDACPHCSGKIISINTSMSQPMIGFIPNNQPLYHECLECGLVILSPAIHSDDIYKIYDDWDTQDFMNSKNNPFFQSNPRCQLDNLLKYLPKKTNSLDLGSGMGNFGKYLKKTFPLWNVTNSDFKSKLNEIDEVNSIALDFINHEMAPETYDFITAWEVIEHIPYEKLDFVFKNIFQALKPGGFFTFSTPNFDSPLCKSFDFFAIAPPFHYLVFGEKWLKNYFSSIEGIEIFDVRHCSDLLEDKSNWLKYAKETAPSTAMIGIIEVLEKIFEIDKNNCFDRKLIEDGFGTEIIITLRKIKA